MTRTNDHKKKVGRPLAGDGVDAKEVVALALRHIDRSGLQKLSMRGLAREVGVDTAALYYHFKSKEDLLDAVVDLIYSEMVWVEPQTQTWQDLSLDLAQNYRDSLIKHPNAFPLIAKRGRKISTTDHYHRYRDYLAEFGVSEQNVREVIVSIELIINGSMTTMQSEKVVDFKRAESDFLIACKAVLAGLTARFK